MRQRTKTLAHELRIEPICVGRDHAAAMLGIGTSMFSVHVSRGNLPKPRELGGRAVWLVEELRAAANGLPVSELLPPRTASRSGPRVKGDTPQALTSCWGAADRPATAGTPAHTGS